MSSISGRLPPVTVEYDGNGGRKRRAFANAYQARSFYVAMFKQGKNPHIVKEQRNGEESNQTQQ